MTRLETILRNQQEEIKSIDFSQFISRKEEKLIDLHSKLAQVVVGVRRSGKSTLCQKVLIESGVKFAYVNFDDETLANLKVEQLNDIIETLYTICGDFTHIFMDEIQNAPSWPLFVNRLLRSGIKIVLTGSNANLLGNDLSTHLAGRCNEIQLYPFSFDEYCRFLQIDTNSKTTKANGLRRNALNKYLIHGGLPEIVGQEVSTPYVASLLTTIIGKDICTRYKVHYHTTLQQLANSILDNFCQEMSYDNYRQDLGIKSVHTVKNYVGYLHAAYLILMPHKYSYKSKERQSSAKCYAIDPAFISIHEQSLQPNNVGWRLENIVAIELFRRIKHSLQNIYYAKKSRVYDIDFVRTDGNKVIELLQVTYDFANPSTRLFNREIQGLVHAANDTHCDNLTLIMMDGEERDIKIDGHTIHCILAINWLLNTSL